ncbi:Crp/Fnr family transcriptional regulator [Rhodopila sp.]|uniref:Crp/Fnr family transcriptional regulator n=1 Tax=Rhodopila sp. TaxID=2480087 RepID=UPI003D0961E3
MDAAARRQALTRTQIFRSLDPALIDAVLARASVRRIARNDVIRRRGDAGTGMVIIVSGRVRIGLISADGREVTLTMLGPGEALGEMTLLDGGECSADATAQEDCVLLIIERTQFLRLLRSNNDLCLHLLSVLFERLRHTNAALEDMALLDLPTRLGRLLLRLSGNYGVAGSRGSRIEVKLSQKDLSNLAGASREKVNRQLRQWEADGVIGKENGRLLIMRPEALAPLD